VCSEINCVVNKIQGLAVGLGEGHPVPLLIAGTAHLFINSASYFVSVCSVPIVAALTADRNRTAQKRREEKFSPQLLILSPSCFQVVRF